MLLKISLCLSSCQSHTTHTVTVSRHNSPGKPRDTIQLRKRQSAQTHDKIKAKQLIPLPHIPMFTCALEVLQRATVIVVILLASCSMRTHQSSMAPHPAGIVPYRCHKQIRAQPSDTCRVYPLQCITASHHCIPHLYQPACANGMARTHDNSVDGEQPLSSHTQRPLFSER